MHPQTEEAFQQIDAGVFSGDKFYTKEGIEMLEKYIGRWQRELVHIKKVVREMEETEENMEEGYKAGMFTEGEEVIITQHIGTNNERGRISNINLEERTAWVSNINQPYCGTISSKFKLGELEKVVIVNTPYLPHTTLRKS